MKQTSAYVGNAANNLTAIGLQWGDEGKGKLVDMLAERASIVARFQGSHNAGHTIVVEGKTHKLALIPSGVLHSDVTCCIGAGVMLEPDMLSQEIEKLKGSGVIVTGNNLIISDLATLLMPVHAILDQWQEGASGGNQIGTTRRGNGPVHESKAARSAIRVADLFDEASLETAIATFITSYARHLKAYGLSGLEPEKLRQDMERIADILRPYVVPQHVITQRLSHSAGPVLLEGAQGFLLDNTYGTYPFVTSSNVLPAYASIGVGVSPLELGSFGLGIFKAYQTRVGAGPFPTETFDDAADYFVTTGNEFGTNTGRKRRCGWLDGVLLKHAVTLSGVSSLAITKVDVLDRLDEIKICVGYRLDGQNIQHMPSSRSKLARAVPIYETFEGWCTDTSQVPTRACLPRNCLRYLERIEALCNRPIEVISVGPERAATILSGSHPLLVPPARQLRSENFVHVG